jgi:hypothetical protein
MGVKEGKDLAAGPDVVECRRMIVAIVSIRRDDVHATSRSSTSRSRRTVFELVFGAWGRCHLRRRVRWLPMVAAASVAVTAVAYVAQ